MHYLVIAVLLIFLAISNARSQPSMEQVVMRAIMLLTVRAGGELIIPDDRRSFNGKVDIYYEPNQIRVVIGGKA